MIVVWRCAPMCLAVCKLVKPAKSGRIPYGRSLRAEVGVWPKSLVAFLSVSLHRSGVGCFCVTRAGRRMAGMGVLQVGDLEPSLAEALSAKYQPVRLPDADQRAAFLAEHG